MERHRVDSPHLERLRMVLSEDTSRDGYRSTQQ
jgi:hypothetical protein